MKSPLPINFCYNIANKICFVLSACTCVFTTCGLIQLVLNTYYIMITVMMMMKNNCRIHILIRLQSIYIYIYIYCPVGNYTETVIEYLGSYSSETFANASSLSCDCLHDSTVGFQYNSRMVMVPSGAGI